MGLVGRRNRDGDDEDADDGQQLNRLKGLFRASTVAVSIPATAKLDSLLVSEYVRFMKDDNRFMSELFRIISGALKLDLDKVRNYTAYLADKLEESGDLSSAMRLRKLLQENAHALRPVGLAVSPQLPVDSESRFPLVERVNARALLEPPIVLTDEQWATVNEFISVAKSHAQLEAAGVGGTHTLLLYGPPGCGKSRLARHIARELSVALYVARLDGIVSSYLGSTSKNLRSLFEFAGRTPGVLFLDELDAIAKVRLDSQELGELKRVVNSFLQNLDSLGSHSIVVAATNHEELLDRAVWRRFTYRLELQYPSLDARTQMWEAFVSDLGFSNKDLVLLADLAEGFSGSDMREVSLRLRRISVMRRVTPELADAFRALLNLASGEGNERRFVARLTGQSSQEIADVLRARDEKLYSHAALARLLGVSKATAFRWTSTTGIDDA